MKNPFDHALEAKPSVLSFHFSNLKPGDVAFLNSVAKLFCDPSFGPMLERFRRGEVSLMHDPKCMGEIIAPSKPCPKSLTQPPQNLSLN